mgnify:CR=1 FL=1
MAIFTFITDYRGGTYICQKTAPDLTSACRLWKEDVVSGGYVQFLDVGSFARAFDENIDALPPVAIDTVASVWVFHLMFGRHMLDLHIVQTDTTTATMFNKLEAAA